MKVKRRRERTYLLAHNNTQTVPKWCALPNKTRLISETALPHISSIQFNERGTQEEGSMATAMVHKLNDNKRNF